MNDEIRQIREELFNYVLLGGVALSLVGGLFVLFTAGPASPWFIRAIALFLVVGLAAIIHWTGRFAVAAYFWVINAIGLVAETFLHTTTLTGFTPYLLVPVALITALLFTPLETLIVTALAMLILLLVAGMVHQFAWIQLALLIPSFLLTLVTALLGLKVRRDITMLSDHLLDSRARLKARTLEIITTQKRLEELQQMVIKLEQRLQRARTEISQAQQQTVQTHDQVNQLIQGATRELGGALKKLEEAITQVEELPGADEYVGVLEGLWQRVDYLRGLTINLEEVSEIEHGQIQLNYEMVDVASLADEVIGVARGLAREKNLEIRQRLPENLPPLQADLSRLRHILLHVLGNAVKYTDEGKIELQAEANEHELTLLVSDTGIGLPEPEAELVFEKFGRGSGLAWPRQGTGLGLAIDKRLVELHGGRMWMNSVQGVGSIVFITLPLLPSQNPEPLAPVDKDAVTPPPNSINRRSRTDSDLTQLSPPGQATLLADAALPARLGQPTGVTPSEPVRRFEARYARRFTIFGLLLLFGLGLLVLALALVNGPAAPATPAARGTRSAMTPTPTGLPAISVVTLVKTTPSPAAPATPEPTATEPPLPTATPSPIATLTPTSARPIRTATLTPAATLTPETVEPSATSMATSEPAPATTPQLAFYAGQTVEGGALAELAPRLKGVENNSRLGWSPDGRQLLFTGEAQGDREIYLIGRESGQPVQLTAAAGDDLQANWSPDGRQIAFSSGRTGNLEIYVMAADGSNLVRLTDSPGFDEWPVWSPSGDRLAFVSDREGNVELYVMQADGSDLRRLTYHPANDWPASWSPDGRRLVFASDRGQDWNLYLIDATGGPVLPLTAAPGNERDPIWSPDGQTIAFAYDGSGNWDIYILPAPTGLPTVVPQSLWTQITTTPTDERYPVWRP